MKEVYKNIKELQRSIEHYDNELSDYYENKIQEVLNYIDTYCLDDEYYTDIKTILTSDNLRLCSHCSKPMSKGYCIDNGEQYYCSDECLHEHYTEEEFEELYDDGNGDSYWTEWESVKYE